MTDLSIIIVNFRGWIRLAKCLDSLTNIDDSRFSFDVVIVDNHSNDGLLESFQERYPRFLFVKNSGNNGFSNGCNLGVKHTNGGCLLFLNPDTVITADAIFELLIETRSRKLCSIVSCQQVREDGSHERPYGHFLTPLTLTGWLRGLAKIGLWKPLKKAIETDDFIYPEWVSGSVIMILRDSLKVLGGWDQDYWMYFEDVDLCNRAGRLGGEIVLIKRCCVEHNHGGSSRINWRVTALTKSEVNISRHVYISKHEVGFKAVMMHTFLLINNLLLGFIPALLGLSLFFVKGLFASANSYFQLVGYYARRLASCNWLSHRSVNYSKL